jgi:mono/diheme cytochrome c family protein
MLLASMTSHYSFSRKRILFVTLITLVLFLSGCVSASQPEPVVVYITATPSHRQDILYPGLKQLIDAEKNPPYMPDEPSQADYGAQVYYQICLACHGDWGQGLTEEWRDTWGEDKNCWQSKCHAPNHPPWGFEIPKIAPPLLGLGSLAQYATAEELHENIAVTMPWWNPGSLTDDQAWQVTAYLLRERGEMDNSITLSEGNASVIRLHQPASKPFDHMEESFLLLGVLFIVAIIVVWNAFYEIKKIRSKQMKPLPTSLRNLPDKSQLGDS